MSPTVRKPVKRSPLKSMRVSEGFRAYVLEQLSAVPHLLARAMFGGVGLYADDLFFGIVAADTLYFKVDDRNRARYTAAGMPPFQPYSDRPMTMSYYQVPSGILEDPDELAAWAREAIEVASRARKQSISARKHRAR
jgi:DNA transformation protein and related proteins